MNYRKPHSDEFEKFRSHCPYRLKTSYHNPCKRFRAIGMHQRSCLESNCALKEHWNDVKE